MNKYLIIKYIECFVMIKLEKKTIEKNSMVILNNNGDKWHESLMNHETI